MPITAPPLTHDEKLLARDLRTLCTFIRVYCQHNHAGATKSPARLKLHDVDAIAGQTLWLCADCRKLLAHALVKRTNCPMHPKPQCKHCPNHCYHPTYRAQIREVMKFSGRKLVMSGRLDYLVHLLF